MNTIFEQLKNFSDINAMRPVLHSLCARFGSVARLDILAASQYGRRQALCFLRMDSAEQEQRVMQALGAGRFGGDLVVIVDLLTPGSVTDHGPNAQAA